jgi:restriction endonuclease S subunit
MNNNNDLFIAKVIVENFPSRVELYSLLDNFISENNYVKDYTTDNKDNMVTFIIKNLVCIVTYKIFRMLPMAS